MFIRSLVLSAVAVGSFGLIGCSESTSSAPNYGGADGTAIARLVEQLNEDKTRKKAARSTFAAGVKLSDADFKKLAKYEYEVEGKPWVSGDTAAATVAFRSESSGDEPEPKEWSFVKENGQWKVQAAPLP